MSGALIDLVAKGVQDAFITGQPEVSFFHQNYKRHTNFVHKTVPLQIMGTVAANSQVSIKIPQKGDLLGNMWAILPGTLLTSGINAGDPESAVFEFYIGGQLIDRRDAAFMVQVWNKFLLDSSAKGVAAYSAALTGQARTDILNSNWLPLHFFTENVYLPIVGLQYHEVEMRIKFGSTDPVGIKFYANYIMLDADERTSVSNGNHELLIEQVQKIFPEGNVASPRFDLNLINHPVKALFWVRADDTVSFVTDSVQLYLNGNEVFEEPMDDVFFTRIQGYYYSEYGSKLLSSTAPSDGSNIKMYSFALKPNKRQPTGSCNFSRLDNASLLLGTTAGGDLNATCLYALNYNVLRIQNGVGGLSFAN